MHSQFSCKVNKAVKDYDNFETKQLKP